MSRWLWVKIMTKKTSTTLYFFTMVAIFIIDGKQESPYYSNMSNKRQYRELDDEVKQKISQSSKGKPKSATHKQHLSQSLLRYWESVPSKQEHLTMQDYLSGEKNNSVKPLADNEKWADRANRY